SPGDPVEPAVPAAFHPLPKGAPKDRLGVAQWLLAPDNSLTARVAVNRFWAQLFGTGIVETEEDFGTQGAPPTHPELLDWLATEFTAPGAAGRERVEVWKNGSMEEETVRSGSSTLPSFHPSTPPHAPWDVKAIVRLIVTSATYRQASRVNPAALA